MKRADFNYELPNELIAQYPLKERDASRMMVLERQAKEIYEKKFRDIAGFISRGDTIILNNAKVIPARLLGKKETGAHIELFLLERLGDDNYKVLAKPSKRLKTGSKVIFDEGIWAEVLENADFGKVVKFSGNIEAKLKSIGQIPLPPYIKRTPEKLDEERYQTVYAKNNGASASPTAGLHFTEDFLNEIKNKGVNIAYVTLNVSYGTFAPVLEENIRDHKMHKEYFRLPKETVEIINDTKKRGNKVIAVGTTTTRVLETCADEVLRIKDTTADFIDGFTDLFIYPGYKFKIVDMLLTNFHLPESTLLMLVSAFAGKPACPSGDTESGRDFVLEAYKKAIEAKFRFFSYGDCMLII